MTKRSPVVGQMPWSMHQHGRWDMGSDRGRTTPQNRVESLEALEDIVRQMAPAAKFSLVDSGQDQNNTSTFVDKFGHGLSAYVVDLIHVGSRALFSAIQGLWSALFSGCWKPFLST